MSERGAEFLLSWVEANIEAQERPPGWDKAEAAGKAEQCLAEAEASGISRAEIEAEVGPIAEYMRVMMTVPTDVGVVHLVPEEEGSPSLH